jgi:hypothetical protein
MRSPGLADHVAVTLGDRIDAARRREELAHGSEAFISLLGYVAKLLLLKVPVGSAKDRLEVSNANRAIDGLIDAGVELAKLVVRARLGVPPALPSPRVRPVKHVPFFVARIQSSWLGSGRYHKFSSAGPPPPPRHLAYPDDLPLTCFQAGRLRSCLDDLGETRSITTVWSEVAA